MLLVVWLVFGIMVVCMVWWWHYLGYFEVVKWCGEFV